MESDTLSNRLYTINVFTGLYKSSTKQSLSLLSPPPPPLGQGMSSRRPPVIGHSVKELFSMLALVNIKLKHFMFDKEDIYGLFLAGEPVLCL